MPPKGTRKRVKKTAASAVVPENAETADDVHATPEEEITTQETPTETRMDTSSFDPADLGFMDAGDAIVEEKDLHQEQYNAEERTTNAANGEDEDVPRQEDDEPRHEPKRQLSTESLKFTESMLYPSILAFEEDKDASSIAKIIQQHGWGTHNQEEESTSVKPTKSKKSRKTTSNNTQNEFDSNFVSRIWKEELDASNCALSRVMALAQSTYLEQYLWPNYDVEASIEHTLSIVAILLEKLRLSSTKSYHEQQEVWNLLRETSSESTESSKFSHLIRNILVILIDKHTPHVPLKNKQLLVAFLNAAFQNLDKDFVRVTLMPLVGLSIWQHLSVERRELELQNAPSLRKAWNKIQKKFNSADDETKETLSLQRRFLFTLFTSFLDLVKQVPDSGKVDPETGLFIERTLAFIVDLLSQLPTRRYVAALVNDLHLLAQCRQSPLGKIPSSSFIPPNSTLAALQWTGADESSGVLFEPLVRRLEFVASFPIDEVTGTSLTRLDLEERHYEQTLKLQKLCFQSGLDELNEVALSNAAHIIKKGVLESSLGGADDDVLHTICKKMGIQTVQRYDEKDVHFDRHFLVERLVERLVKLRTVAERIRDMPIYPEETMICDEVHVPASRLCPTLHPHAIPRLGLQYLTLDDLLFRSFTLLKYEDSARVRREVESALRKLNPYFNPDTSQTEFNGTSRNAVKIDRVVMVEIGRPKVGEKKPSIVKADLSIDLTSCTEVVKREWSTLKQGDSLTLLGVEKELEIAGWTDVNEAQQQTHTRGSGKLARMYQEFGLKYIRGASVLMVSDAGQNRLLIRVLFDTSQYARDMDTIKRGGLDEDPYTVLNVAMKRSVSRSRLLTTVKEMILASDLVTEAEQNVAAVVPSWLQDLLLGLGDPQAAHYSQLPNASRSLDMDDTFVDIEHAKEHFEKEGAEVIVKGVKADKFRTRYRVTLPRSSFAEKDGDDDEQMVIEDDEKVVIETYQEKLKGPYPQLEPGRNQTRFTPAQSSAILSATQPGLTLINGCPGSGKSLVTSQIIHNIYRNFPSQRTLLVAKSQGTIDKILGMLYRGQIDSHKILNMGEIVSITTKGDKVYGPVQRVMLRRTQLLAEVDRLAVSLEAVGAHGNSCETAGYFYLTHVQPKWQAFTRRVAEGANVRVPDLFPFTQFFVNAPQPLFKDTARESSLEIAKTCYKYIQSMFTELESLRVMETLRSDQERFNHLFSIESRLVASTLDECINKRVEWVNLGCAFDTIIIMDAESVMEVEAVGLLTTQSRALREEDETRLQRVVMIGDDRLLPSKLSSDAFSQVSNLNRPLFERLSLLGVNRHHLKTQFTTRPEIANLWRHHYGEVEDSDKTSTEHNSGFVSDVEVVDVGEFMGKGEIESVPGWYQNLGEAEYVVAVYQYMRLIGYPNELVSIITPYESQKQLIQDVLNRRCARNPMFGVPSVDTIENYQGKQNDYILLSLVRSKDATTQISSPITISTTFAKRGLYIFCNKALFSHLITTPQLKELFAKQSGGQLLLADNEQYPETAPAKNKIIRAINGVEEMGRYVHGLLEEKIRDMRRGGPSAKRKRAAPEDEEAGREEGDSEGGSDNQE